MKKPEIKEILKSFNEDMNAELGNVSTVDYKGKTIPGSERPVTPADYIEFYQDEWQKTVEKLAEAGLDLEEEMIKKETKKEIKVKTRIPYIAFIKDDALGKVIEEIRKIEKEHSCNCTLLDVEIN